jgi:hypothetical protein
MHNGLGRYDSAFAAAQRACGHDDLGLFGWTLIELVEAGVRTGKPDTAAAASWQLGQRTRASGTEWALGIAARSRALLSHGQAADIRYREAIERLASSRITVHLARARLLYRNGCAGSAVATKPASSRARPATCSAASAPRDSPSGPGTSCAPPARPPASAPPQPGIRS